MITSLAVDWVTLSTAEFVAWARLHEVPLPFPLNTGGQPYIAAPERQEIERTLASRRLDTSAVLETVRAALAEPRLVLYAVRVLPDGTESKAVSVADHGEAAVLILLDRAQVSLRQIGETELAASVVGALPHPAGLPTPTAQVTLSALQSVDSAVAAGVSERTLHAAMATAGLPEPLIALQLEHSEERPVTGALGAVGFGTGSPAGRHSTRSATWREFESGAVLQVELGVRNNDPVIELSPFSPDRLFRAAVDAIASLYEAGTQ